jgi:rod shape-determining protein MreD
MNSRGLRTLFLCLVLIVLHFAVTPLLGWRVTPDFLVIAVLLAAVRMRPGVAAATGMVVGLLGDALVPEAFGVGAFTLTALGFAASWLKAVFFSDNVLLHGVFFFAGKWVHDVVSVLMHQSLGWGDGAVQLLLWSPLAAALTSIAGLLLLVLFRGILEPPGT